MNFLIAYCGKDGSSPLVASLSKHSEIVVPLFEGLDWYKVDQQGDADSFKSELPRVIDGIYASGEFHDDLVANYGKSERAAGAVIGFKWRVWGDTAKVGEVLRKNNVACFHMVRRDFAEYMFSVYATHEVLKHLKAEIGSGDAPQFKLRKSDASTKEKYWEELRRLTFDVDWSQFREHIRKRLAQRDKLIRKLETLKMNGVPVKTVCYEDFCADKAATIGKILAYLGLNWDSRVLNSDFEKVLQKPATEMARNCSEITQYREFIDARATWKELVERFPVVGERSSIER